jgi:membrane protein YqaA with SNARE-associated domain
MDTDPVSHIATWFKFSAYGGLGIFACSFLDSSFLPLPLVTDLLLMELCSLHPLRAPFYSIMATVGSVGGCVCVYWLARKGGEAYYLRKQNEPPKRVQRFIQEHPVACVVLPAIAPFPVPFKPFVIAQGVFQVPFMTFVLGTAAGRGLLFFAEGLLAAWYGESAKKFILDHKWNSIAVVSALLLLYLLVRQFPLFRKWGVSQAP